MTPALLSWLPGAPEAHPQMEGTRGAHPPGHKGLLPGPRDHRDKEAASLGKAVGADPQTGRAVITQATGAPSLGRVSQIVSPSN